MNSKDNAGEVDDRASGKYNSSASNLRHKIFISFSSLGLFFATLSAIVVYLHLHSNMQKSVSHNLRDIVSITAIQISGNELNSLTNANQRTSKSYRQIQEILDSAFCSELGIESAYTIRKNKNNDIVFVVDAETNTNDAVRIGQVYSNASPLITENYNSITTATTEAQPYKDEFGTWLSAYAPILDNNDKIAGLVGIDIDVNEVIAERNKLILTLIAVLLIAIPFIIASVLMASRSLSAKAIRMEEQLQRKRQQLELVMQGSNIGWWDWNIADGSEVYNSMLPQLLNCCPETLKLHDESWTDNIHPDDRKNRSNSIRNHLDGQSEFYICTYRIKTQDGKWVWFADHGQLVERTKDGKPYRMLGTIRNVNEQQISAHKLKESEELYRLLVDNTADLIWVVDTNFIFTYMSPAIKDILGYEVNDVVGHSLSEFVKKETEIEIKQLFIEKVARGPDAPAKLVEFNIRNIDGKFMPVETKGRLIYDDKGQPVAMQGVLRDISKRKAGEAERERLLQAIEQATETIVITDPQADILYVNPAFLTLTGYTLDEVMGKNPRFLKSGQHDKAFYTNMWKLLLAGKTWSGKITNKRKDGSFFTEDASISPVRDQSGKVVSYVSVRRDISNEIILEQQLHQAQKMEAIGLLAGGIAHDFNNILQTINGYSDLALLDTDKAHAAYTPLQHISEASNKAAALVRQILAFSRRQVLDMQSVDLNSLITKLESSMLRTLGAHIKITFHASQGLSPIKADPIQIEQIIMNICLNARDAMPEGGTIIIRTEPVTINKEFCQQNNSDAKPGAYAKLTITDNGCGMDKDILQNIFDPFFTTKDVGAGTGLGLSTAYGLVNQHSGIITVNSKVKHGTTFDIYLPLVNEASPESEPTQKASTPDHGNETILLAEDDKGVFTIATTFLEMAGYHIVGAEDGQKAIEQLKKHASEIDLALLDVMMPHKSGKDVYEYIQEHCPEVKVLFASGYSMNAIHTHFVLDDGVNLLPKPYKRSELLQAVRSVLDS